MKNINWLVRVKNKMFWISLIPAVIVLIQTIAAVFGFTIDLSELGDNLVNVINAVFVVLAILGIVIDPTTAGAGDSENAMILTQSQRLRKCRCNVEPIRDFLHRLEGVRNNNLCSVARIPGNYSSATLVLFEFLGIETKAMREKKKNMNCL